MSEFMTVLCFAATLAYEFTGRPSMAWLGFEMGRDLGVVEALDGLRTSLRDAIEYKEACGQV
jgi:hypothetical protein